MAPEFTPLPNSDAPRRGRILGRLAAAGGVVLFIGAGLAWWYLRPPPLQPPMPTDLNEEEVRQVLEKSRRQVLDDPTSAEAWGEFGMRLFAHLFDREADICFAQAARLDPEDPKWPYARGIIALKRRPDEAVGLLREALAAKGRPPFEPAARLQLAEALLERGALDEAEQLFRAQDAEQPGSPRAALGLGLVAVARGEREAAEQHFRVAGASPFAKKLATAQLARLARSRGDQRAATALEQELAALPTDPPWPDPVLDELVDLEVGKRGRERLVGRLEMNHEYREAAAIYLQELESHPTMEACVGAGMNFAHLREYDRAFELLRKGVELGPDSANAHASLALVLMARAERDWHDAPGEEQLKEWFREAIAHAKRATELRPDHARAYLTWGLALKFLGQPEAALAPLRKGIACHPADFDLQLALAETLMEAGRRQEADTYLDNARRLRPDDPRLARIGQAPTLP